MWIGAGIGGIDGLTVGDPVTAEQMRALFGCGLHPLAELGQQQLEGPDLSLSDFQDAARLGAPFRVLLMVSSARSGSRSRNASGRSRRQPALRPSAAAGRRTVPSAGRVGPPAPGHARELAGQIAKDSRPRTQTVAGYDLTFSPVKSVSTLWAVVDPAMAAVIERAHQAAVTDALAFIENHALFTRTGPQGIRQVNVRGARRDRVHPPGQPDRRPGSAHPRGGGEQGAGPRRAVVVDRPVEGQCCRLGDLQHRLGGSSCLWCTQR